MSGSAVADAAGPGLVIARMMIRDGRYGAGFAAATSAAAATIGPIVPPSIPMIFYALIANTSVAAMFLGGLVPAALMAASLIACIAFLARRKDLPSNAAATAVGDAADHRPRDSAADAAGSAAGHHLLRRSPHRPRPRRSPPAYALMLTTLVYRTTGLADLLRIIAETVRGIATVGLIIVGAFVFNFIIANENVPMLLQSAIASWHPSPLAFLLLVNVLFLALACVLDAITMLLVLVPLLVPLAVGLGIDPVHFGVVVILNMMIGLALPPHGLLLFVMHGLVGAPLGSIFREVLPLIGALLVVLAAVTLVPELVLALPRALGY